jgi:hypothetical protein
VDLVLRHPGEGSTKGSAPKPQLVSPIPRMAGFGLRSQIAVDDRGEPSVADPTSVPSTSPPLDRAEAGVFLMKAFAARRSLGYIEILTMIHRREWPDLQILGCHDEY